MNTFRDFLLRKQLEKGIEMGRQIRAKDFAEYIGVGPTTLSSWINGGSIPNYPTLEKLSHKLGMGVFEAAGYTRPDNASLPEGLRPIVSSFLNELLVATKDVPDGSPEQREIVKSVMQQFGLTLIENTTDEPGAVK